MQIVCERCRSRRRRTERTYTLRLRTEVIAAYGGRCACCGEAEPQFLTIDHVANDGAAARRATGRSGGKDTYVWLRKNGYPRNQFQLLCFNCNCAKGGWGRSPHEVQAHVG
jgi:hypothetical protein